MTEDGETNELKAIVGVIRYLVEGIAHGELTERECIQTIWHTLDTPLFPMQEPDGVPTKDAWWREIPPNMIESDDE